MSSFSHFKSDWPSFSQSEGFFAVTDLQFKCNKLVK
nr:MAG TPA: Alpha-kinase family [Caudoviricetes sp.]